MARSESRWGAQLHDPTVLKALAHPARLRMLDVLQELDGATATQCAARVGLSPSACSWHLRLLARSGLVEDAGRGPDGRERAWRSRVPAWQVDFDAIDADETDARALDIAVTRAMLAASDSAVEAFTAAAAHGNETQQWRDAALVSNSTLRLTAEELTHLTEQMRDLLRPYTLRQRPQAPAGARPVHAALRFAPQSSPDSTD